MTAVNGLCDDEKNETLEDKHECRIAFADFAEFLQNPQFQINPDNIEHKIDESFSSNSYPSRCIIQRSGSIFTVRWNEISNGNRESSTRQICKNGTMSLYSNRN